MYRIMRIVLLGVFCCTAAVIIAFGYVSIVHGQKNPKANRLGQNKIDVHDFNPQVVLGPQPPIVNPPFVRAGEALDKIQPNELVLGVVVDGVAAATVSVSIRVSSTARKLSAAISTRSSKDSKRSAVRRSRFG